jgi:tRNA nucleotidyltransferase/poly(A) polymerase
MLPNYLKEMAEQVSKWNDYVSEDPELDAAVEILKRINSKGYKAFIVGGAVRDIVMGKKPKDIDIATNMPIDEIEKIWKSTDIGKSKDFGIVLARHKGHSFEIAQFRQDGKYVDGRRPEDVTIAGSFQQDAERRDFTINAMGVDKDGNIIDYFDGTRDIKDKVLRTVGNPKDRFGEDYLRMMRAARFSSRLGFDIDPATKTAAKELSGNVKKLAAERIKDEIFKAAGETGDKFAKFIAELDDMGILDIILPEVTKLKGFEHDPEHHPEGDVWQHTLAALKYNKVADPLVNLSILLHDVGKGLTFDLKPDGTPSYFGHAEEGVKLVDDIADRLRMSAKEKETLLYTVGNHMKFHLIHKIKPSKIARLVSDDNWDVLVAVARADEFSRGEKFMSDQDFEDIVNTAIEVKNKWGSKGVTKLMKIVDGNRVMELTGLKPGKEVGKVIAKVTEWVIDNNITDQEDIDRYIKSLFKPDIGINTTEEREMKLRTYLKTV